jgi:hypothetical protein
MARASHIKVRRRLYWHHGIDMGDGTVVHASGEPGRRKRGARIRRSRIDDFLRGGARVTVESEDALPPERIAARAEASLGQRTYSLLLNNCEHFARWCQTGRPESAQVDRAAWTSAALGVALQVGLVIARRSGPRLILRMLPFAAPLSVSISLIGASLALASRLRRR